MNLGRDDAPLDDDIGDDKVEPIISSSPNVSTKHRVEFNCRVGFVYEYPGPKFWARIESPDKKLGSFPTMDEAIDAIRAELT